MIADILTLGAYPIIRKEYAIADFILRDMESIVVKWEAFAATLLPAAASMTPLALRNEAKQILEAVATICQRCRRSRLRLTNLSGELRK